LPAPTQPAAPPDTPGRIITLEGIDGAGTTTQARLLADRLAARAFSVVETFEPSGGPIGALIRHALARTHDLEHVNAEALALLFAADRLEHHHRVVRPALESGAMVVTDRSVISSLAYQGMELSPEWVATLNGYALLPHFVFWIDVDPEICIDRIVRRGGTQDRYEHLDLLKRLHTRYDEIANQPPLGVVFARVDGTQPIEDVLEAIWSTLQDHLPAGPR
jgi:dTMP kinase